MCEVDDGSTAGPYDLVVGCDGIRSAVWQYVNDGEIWPAAPASPASAIYSGLRITFAIQDGGAENATVADDDACRLNQYFGDGAYALTSSYGTGKGRPPARGAFLVYADEDYVGPFRKSKEPIGGGGGGGGADADPPRGPDENPDWTQDRRASPDRFAGALEVLRSAGVPGLGDVPGVVRGSDRSFDLGGGGSSARSSGAGGGGAAGSSTS